MLPSRSKILVEATSTLIKTLSIVIFLNLYHTFITYDRPESNKQQAKSNEQRAKSNELREKVTSNEQKVTSNEQKVQPHTKYTASPC